jgi:solute carrier family 25 carnitine/acylcarnitine transporter 20/29
MDVFWSSFIAGSLQTIIGHPFDTIKTRIQLNHHFSYKYLYRGAFPNLISGCIQNGILFSFHHYCYSHLDYHFLSGVCSGTISSLFVSPLELLKCQLQSTGKMNGLYLTKGLSSTIARDSIGIGIYFSTYHHLKEELHLDSFWSGGFAGIASWIYSYPIDVIKTRIQCDKMINCKNLYVGFHIVIIRSFLVNSSIFYVFDKLKY